MSSNIPTKFSFFFFYPLLSSNEANGSRVWLDLLFEIEEAVIKRRSATFIQHLSTFQNFFDTFRPVFDCNFSQFSGTGSLMETVQCVSF